MTRDAVTGTAAAITTASDRCARDVIELGLRAGLLKKASSKAEKSGEEGGVAIVDSETGEVYGKTINAAVSNLTDDVVLLDELQQRVLEVAQPEEMEEAAE